MKATHPYLTKFKKIESLDDYRKILHSLQTGKRLTQSASHSDITFKSYNNYNLTFSPRS